MPKEHFNAMENADSGLSPREIIQKQIVELGKCIEAAQSKTEKDRLMDEAMELKQRLEQSEGSR